MPVIVASPAYPRPPIDGDKVRWSALLPELARLEPLHGVFGFMPPLGEVRDPSFDRAFASVDVVSTSRFEVSARAALLELRRRPSAFGRRATPRWRRAVHAAVAQHAASPVLLLGTSGGYAPSLGSPTFLDLIDVRSRVRTRTGDHLTRGNILKAELALARRHSLVLACDADRQWLMGHGADGGRVHVVPHGVDRRFLTVTPDGGSRTVLFVGNLRYRPNRDALSWFLEAVWPGLRPTGATLRIVGHGADRIAAGPNVEVISDAPDVLTHYEAAALGIAPMLEARGTQFKVLESMAAGLPVVCTTPVARGLFADHPALVADEPQAFIAACTALLDQPSTRTDLGRRGSEYIRRHHDWAASAAALRYALLGSDAG